MKNTIFYKEKLRHLVDEIPQDRLALALDFLEYIKDREEWEATNEILNDTEMMKGILKGKDDIKKGRWKKWTEIKRNV